MRKFWVSVTIVAVCVQLGLGSLSPAAADGITNSPTVSFALTSPTGELTDTATAGLEDDGIAITNTSLVQRQTPVLKAAADDVPTNAVVLTEQIETSSDFNVAALTWAEGTTMAPESKISVRVRESDGWSEWLPLDPDEASDTNDARGGTDPFITGSSDAVQVAIEGDATALPDDLQLVIVYVNDGSTTSATSTSYAESSSDRATSLATNVSAVSAQTASSTLVTQPTIITRSQWGADEGLMTWAVQYAPLTAAVIHHTAGTNDYTASQSAAIVRGIYYYHAITRNWGDIGYNFLVDKYGQIFEGRSGSLAAPADQMAVGGHARGYNTGTLGISALGDYTLAAPTQALYDAYTAVIDWRFDLAWLDASDSSGLTAEGSSNSAYQAGAALPRVFGHRDVGTTACPGNAISSEITTLISRVGDASPASYFYDTNYLSTDFVSEINWMYQAGISTGWTQANSRLTYRPSSAVQRGAVAAFLFRLLADDSYVAPSVSPFADVSSSYPFYREIAWMYESGVATGWVKDGVRTYRPDADIQRDAMAAFLYRAAGSPEITADTTGFVDVASTRAFATEITWMRTSGLTTGWRDGTFRPSTPVLREQIAAFLYRWAN